MSIQSVRTGTTINDKQGDPLRTAFTKINTNFSSVFTFLTGSPSAVVLPTALPITSGGTGASTASGARKALGLGDLATAKIGTDEGDVLLVGTVGLGTDLSPRANEAEKRAVTAYKSGELECQDDTTSYVTLATRDSAIKHQLGVGPLDGVLTPLYRTSDGEVFGEWHSILTSQNTVETVNGNLKSAKRVVRLANGSALANTGEAIEMTRTAKGSYTLTATLNKSNWTLEVPMDYKGTVEFDVTLTQAGTALNVAVTQEGVAFDIPVDKWIDIHIE